MARWFIALLLVLVAMAGVLAWTSRIGTEAASRRPIGLFTSLPIFWQETDDLAQLVKRDAKRHWALPVLERYGPVRPLDRLDSSDGNLPLGPDALLVMAQPRPLSPQENVALDNWVTRGGRVLLFADPMLTQDSAFALGDRRRPQDVVLLSPILSRWGLALRFDEAQPYGEREAMLFGAAFPVNLPGHLTVLGGTGQCHLLAHGLAARCRVGKGGVLAVADAALLEDRPEAGARAGAARSETLARLLAEAGNPGQDD